MTMVQRFSSGLVEFVALRRHGKAIEVRFEYPTAVAGTIKPGRYRVPVPEMHHAPPQGAVSATRLILNHGYPFEFEFAVDL